MFYFLYYHVNKEVGCGWNLSLRIMMSRTNGGNYQRQTGAGEGWLIFSLEYPSASIRGGSFKRRNGKGGG